MATKEKTLTERLLSLKPRARTVEECAAELGVSVKEMEVLLKKPGLPRGTQMVKWTDHLGPEYFEMLAPEKPRPVPQSRAFRFMTNPNESYIRVFIPDNVLDVDGKPAKFIELWPFSDVHWGHRRCDRKNFNRDVKEVERRPNRFCFLNGDNMENALGDSAGGAAWAEQSATPKEQRNQLEEVFRRIAHKVLCAHPGNHEARTTKKTLMDPLEEVAGSLGIPYFPGPINMEVIWKGYRWTFHISHGTGASNTIGGKMAMAGKARHYNDFRNFLIVGHVHDEMTHRLVRLAPRRKFKGGKLDKNEFWVERMKEYKIICPAYLLYSGTYAEEAGYSPGSRNTVTIQLFANGDYHVVSTKRRKNGDEEELVI
jgi:hypothetical protein